MSRVLSLKPGAHLSVGRAVRAVTMARFQGNVGKCDDLAACIAIKTTNHIAGHEQAGQSALSDQVM